MVRRRHDGKDRTFPIKTAASPLCLVFSAICGLFAGSLTTLSIVVRDDASSIASSTIVTLETQKQEFQSLRVKRDSSTVLSELSESTSSRNHPEHHTVFSTSCSSFQDLQSYIFYYHAWKVEQPGNVTRIVSGCTPEQEIELRQRFKEQIAIMSDRFRLHFTPRFSIMKDGNLFPFANKPNGLKHWMEHVLGYPNNTQHDDDIVILLDPDQLLLRPLTYDFTNTSVVWHETRMKNTPALQVKHGKPFAAMYGYREQWQTKVNVTYVAGPDSPIHNISLNEAIDYFPAGPPYMATARDMYSIVEKWTEFLPRVFEVYPKLLGEMFAYSLAAAHLGLPHQCGKSFMLSEVTAFVEGWDLIDTVPAKDVCYNVPKDKLPHAIHYCQRYRRGAWFISKHALPKAELLTGNTTATCQSPLLAEPPSDTAIRYNYSIFPGKTEKRYHKKPEFNRREAFMLCTMIRAFNEAAEFFKKHNCPAGAANFNKTRIL